MSVMDNASTKPSGVKVVVAALVASVAILGVTALLTDGDRADRTSHLSTYVTGQTPDAGPSVSDYPPAQPAPVAPVMDDAAMHSMELGR